MERRDVEQKKSANFSNKKSGAKGGGKGFQFLSGGGKRVRLPKSKEEKEKRKQCFFLSFLCDLQTKLSNGEKGEQEKKGGLDFVLPPSSAS